MEALAGFTVAVTADRRADEQAALLERRGATALRVPLVRTEREPDEPARRATADLVARPPDVVLATTGLGVRTWVASAWAWGMGEELLEALGGARVLARGHKAAGALHAEGVEVAWREPAATVDDAVAHLIAAGVDGRRVAVQRHGGDLGPATARLREAGADVVEVALYRWADAVAGPAPGRLVDGLSSGEVDAVTLTSPAAARALGRLVASRRHRPFVTACVGPLTARAARDAGLPDVVEARPARLGAMVRALADRLAGSREDVVLAGVGAVLQGGRLLLDGHEVRLTPRERTVLQALVQARGAVVSKGALAASAFAGAVDDHAVEVAVNRLRRKLGPAAAAIVTTNRRGYRLAVERPAPLLERRPGG